MRQTENFQKIYVYKYTQAHPVELSYTKDTPKKSPQDAGDIIVVVSINKNSIVLGFLHTFRCDYLFLANLFHILVFIIEFFWKLTFFLIISLKKNQTKLRTVRKYTQHNTASLILCAWISLKYTHIGDNSEW